MTDPSPFDRVALLFGDAALPKLAAAHVCIAGLGAVGATVAESLARTGVSHFTLVDFDDIRPSNINRHPFAFYSTIGHPKIQTVAHFIRDINPAATLSLRPLFLDAQTIPPLIAEHPRAILVDAIDALGPKVGLLLEAHRIGLPFILSCLGAARHPNPSAFVAGDLFHSSGCPLARLVRKRLHRRGVTQGIRAIYSPQPPAPLLPPHAPEPNALARGRHRTPMGSLHAATTTAALLAAHEVLRHILSPQPHPPSPA